MRDMAQLPGEAHQAEGPQPPSVAAARQRNRLKFVANQVYLSRPRQETLTQPDANHLIYLLWVMSPVANNSIDGDPSGTRSLCLHMKCRGVWRRTVVDRRDAIANSLTIN